MAFGCAHAFYPPERCFLSFPSKLKSLKELTQLSKVSAAQSTGIEGEIAAKIWADHAAIDYVSWRKDDASEAERIFQRSSRTPSCCSGNPRYAGGYFFCLPASLVDRSGKGPDTPPAKGDPIETENWKASASDD